MGNQIICPHCKRIISNNKIIDEAAKGEGSDSQFIICECGEESHTGRSMRNSEAKRLWDENF